MDTKGATLLADKGYDSDAIREAAASKNAWTNIPSRSNRKQRFGFSGWLYRQRNLVERFFNPYQALPRYRYPLRQVS